ncbi:MAG TPA: type II secretion system F family protein [Thermoanaerobaculia bacterium]|nr:type II secretion system F family protein [Thermoanaerobaculia bacterium]
MPHFWYEALTSTGQVEKATMAATSEEDLAERLRQNGAYLVRSRPAEKPAPARKADGKVPRKQLLALIEYMAGSARVGLPIMTTLTDVEPRLESKLLRKIVAEMRDTMSLEGKSLSEAMREHPKAFDSFYVSTVEAGEASGQLDFVLEQLVKHLDWQETLGSQIRQAVTYPIIIVVAIIGLLLVLVGFVFPRLIPILTSRAVELPLATRLVIGASEVIRDFWLVGVAAAVGAALLLAVARRQEDIATAIDAAVLRVPIFGELILQINMARLVTYLSLFYRTGLNIILSLKLTANMVRNRAIARAVDGVREGVTGGESLGVAFGASPLFPPIVMRSITLGEVTGHLDDALQRTSIYYEREVPAAVKRMVTGLQPLLIVFMGGAVLLVALAIILPILGIYDSIGRR